MTDAVFTVAPEQGAAVAEVLATYRIALQRPRWVSATVYDTFDGRLNRSGMRLEVTAGQMLLKGAASGSDDLAGRPVPDTVDDLHAGPIRDAVAPVIGERALIPQAVVLSSCAAGRGGGLTVQWHTLIHVEGHRDLGAVVMEVSARPRTLQRFARSMVAAGVEPGALDHVSIAVAGAGISLAGRTTLPTVPLQADMVAERGFRLVLADLAAVIDANRDGVLMRRDTEFLHDLRVAVRRSRTLLKFGKTALRGDRIAAASRRLAWTADRTSAARDLDVHVQGWDAYTAGIDGPARRDLQPLREMMEGELEREYATLGEALTLPYAREVDAEWRRWLLEGSPCGAKRGDQPLGRVVADLADGCHRRVRDNGRAITKRSPAQELHDLRKDAKHLRYLLECFGSLMDDGALKQFNRQLKRLQDNLGEHQDAEVQVEHLRVTKAVLAARGASPRALAAVELLAQELDRRRIVARREFHSFFAEYDTKQTTRSLRALLAPLRTNNAGCG